MVFGRGKIRKSKSGSGDESSGVDERYVDRRGSNGDSDESYSSNSSSYFGGRRNLRDVMSYSYDKHEVTKEEFEQYYYEDRYAEKKCCTIPKLAVFFIFLGLTFGLVFGLVDLDRINGVINGGNSTGTEPTDDRIIFDDDNGAVEPYEFMQCPEVGECCNGLETNCGLAPHEILWATVHNANHDGLVISNNEAPLEEALEAGYRGLMIDVCLCNDGEGNFVIQFCHLICGIGYRDPIEVFTNIGAFLDRNPSEIVMINFEMSHGNPTPAQLWSVADSVPGLRQKTVIHRAGRLPVMRNLLANGRQLILYKHNGNNCNEESAVGCTNRIAEYFNSVIETPFTFKDVDAVSDSSQSCWPYRGADGRKDYYSINNFVTGNLGPSKLAALTINKEAYLRKRLVDCEAVTGYEPNIVAVDYWQVGDLVKVVQEVNIFRGNGGAVSLMSRIQKFFFGD